MSRLPAVALLLASFVTGCFLMDPADGVRGTGGPFEGDDDDGGSNPYDVCFLIWDQYVDRSPTTFGHRAYVAAELQDWTTGTMVFDGDGAAAVFLYGITFGSDVQASYLSTSGTATVFAENNALGAEFSLSIGSAPPWFLTSGTGGTITGGTGDADAYFNDVEDCFGVGDLDDCLIGSGPFSITVGTTSLTLGDASSSGSGATVGFCEDSRLFSGSVPERASQLARRLPARPTP